MKQLRISLSGFFAFILIAFLSSCSQVNPQQEKAALTELLGEFLTNVDDPNMHDRLWARRSGLYRLGGNTSWKRCNYGWDE